MRRFTAWFCILVPIAQGCADGKRPVDSTVVPANRFGQIVRQDRERLAGVDSPRHLSHTYLGVDVTDDNAFSAVGHVIGSVTMRIYRFAQRQTPLKSAAAMQDAQSPDNRREGIMELVQNRFARKDPYTKRYSQIGENDPEFVVRAAAIRALNYSRSREGADLYVAGLNDSEAPVRLEAAKALANLPDEKAVPRLIALLQKDDNKDVRIAAADALRNFKTLDVARALTSTMTDRDFSVTWQARQSLILMTGRDFGYDESAWLDYISKGSKPFV
jgi:hypothetical protein